MSRLMLVLFLLVSAWCGVAAAQTASPPGNDEIRSVITRQLEAFSRDQDAEAYSYAAPIIQFAFPTVDSFMSMVKKGYQPVYRNSGYRFGGSGVDVTGRPTQTVIIQGNDGKTYEASYTLEQQSDGTWKIAGCIIRALPGTAV